MIFILQLKVLPRSFVKWTGGNQKEGKGGGGVDFLENSSIWVGHNKMLLGMKNFKKRNLTFLY